MRSPRSRPKSKVGRNFGPAQLNLAVARPERIKTSLNGSAQTDGSYHLQVEALTPLPGRCGLRWAASTAIGGTGQPQKAAMATPAAQTQLRPPVRTLIAGACAPGSTGNAWRFAQINSAPYADLATTPNRSWMPIPRPRRQPGTLHFAQRKSDELRIGLNAASALDNGMSPARHAGGGAPLRTERRTDLGRGNPGCLASTSAAMNQRNWLRAGAGGEQLVDGMASLWLNATTGRDPSAWLAAELAKAF